MSNEHTGERPTEDSLATLYARCLEEIQRLLDHTTVLTAEMFRAVAHTVQDKFAKTEGVHQDELQRVIDTLMQRWQEVFTSREQVCYRTLSLIRFEMDT